MIDEGLTEQRQTSLNAYLLPREYVNISDASQTTGSGVHDYLELIYSRDGNETAEQRQASPHDYHGLDPSVLATPRQPPAPRAYTSPRHKTPGVGQDVHDTVSGGRNPAYYVGLDSAAGTNTCCLMSMLTAVLRKPQDRMYTENRSLTGLMAAKFQLSSENSF